MGKRPPKMIVTPLKTLPKALIVGPKDILTAQVLKALEKRGCQIFFRQKLADLTFKVDYIFQFGEFEQTEKLLEKAKEDRARYLLVEEEGLVEARKKAEKLVSAFKDQVDGRVLRIKKSPFSNASGSTNQVLKAIFGQRKPLPSPLKSKEKKVKKKAQGLLLPLKKSAFPLAFLFALFLSPYIFFGLNFFLGAKNLDVFKHDFFRADLVKAQDSATSAQEFFSRAKKVGLVSNFFPLLKTGQNLAFFGESLSQIAFSSIKISQIGQKTARLVLEEEKGMVKERLDQLKTEVENLERQILLTEALFEDLGLASYQNIKAFSLGDTFKKISTTLSSGKELCLLVKKTLPLSSEILGFKKDKIYLLLFQNNMELRPGGGFIGSYGLVHFEKGVLKKLETHDIYTADGQLKGHVEPPAAIKKYLNQPHFFLRDSNFSPDFAVNGQKAVWFFKKEIGIDVDGVIAVDLSFAQKLLEGLGGVYLPDYKQEITSENLFLKAESFAQEGFFPGSTQKRDFLGALARGILARIKVGEEIAWYKIGQALKEGLDEKHIQIFLFDSKGQKIVEELGWAGRIPAISCTLPALPAGRRATGCFPDYLMIVEANLGVNKANYFVKREIGLETELTEKKLSHQLSIAYQNISPGQTYPGGVYKNYLRIFVPKETVLERVKSKGKEIPIKQVETEQEEDKKSWGILVEIGPGEKAKVEFEYSLSFEKTLASNQFGYELFFQKQAGTEKDPLFLKFNYPKTWQVKKTNFPAFPQNGILNYTSDLSVDRIFSIEFDRNP